MKKLGVFVDCAAKVQLRQKGVIYFISVEAKHSSKSDQPTRRNRSALTWAAQNPPSSMLARSSPCWTHPTCEAVRLFRESVSFAKGLQSRPASFGLPSQDSVSDGPQRQLRPRHGVSAGLLFSVDFYKSRVEIFMCNGSSYTTKGFPSTFGLFRADNEAKLKEQKSSAFKMEEVHFLNLFALSSSLLYWT